MEKTLAYVHLLKQTVANSTQGQTFEISVSSRVEQRTCGKQEKYVISKTSVRTGRKSKTEPLLDARLVRNLPHQKNSREAGTCGGEY
jgi:hypothetical protein